MAEITVMLADDHALVRRGFRRLLEDDDQITVVGEASTGAEAVKMAAQMKPTVIVMDCAMPDGSGLDATRQILAERPEAAVLMLSMHSEETLVRQALSAGARGYVLKSALDSRIFLQQPNELPPARRKEARRLADRLFENE